MAISVSFPFFWAAQPGAWGSAYLGAGFLYRILSLTGLVSKLINRGPERSLCWVLAFSTASYSNWSGLQTNWLPVFTEVYNSSTPTFFLWASQLHSFNPSRVKVIILIFLDRMHLLFTQVHFLFWQPSKVVCQYTTSPSLNCNKSVNSDKSVPWLEALRQSFFKKFTVHFGRVDYNCMIWMIRLASSASKQLDVNMSCSEFIRAL